jgi:hypothetical protein
MSEYRSNSAPPSAPAGGADATNQSPAMDGEMLLLRRLESVHGSLFEIDPQSGRVMFGDVTAAHFFAELLQISYSPHDDTFVTSATDGISTLLPKSTLHKLIADWLRARAIAAGIPYVSHSPAALVIAQLKRVCAVKQLDAAEGLHLFAAERLERKALADVTTAELLVDYREFCLTRNCVSFPERRFLQRVTTAIRDKFGLSKNHCVRRTDSNGNVALRYGWRNLSIKGA